MTTRIPFQQHSAESEDAAHAAAPKAPTQRARVLAAIQRAGRTGLTDHEIQISLRLNPSTQRPRRVDLVKAGLVVKSTRTRKTPSGRKAAVWIAAEHVEPQQRLELPAPGQRPEVRA